MEFLHFYEENLWLDLCMLLTEPPSIYSKKYWNKARFDNIEINVRVTCLENVFA